MVRAGQSSAMGSCPRHVCDLCKPRQRAWGLWSDKDCGSIISWGGVLETSVFVLAVDLLHHGLPTGTPMGGPGYFGCSYGCGLDRGLM